MLVVAVGVEARWDVGEIVEALTVVAAAAAVGGVADSAGNAKDRVLSPRVCVREDKGAYLYRVDHDVFVPMG